MNFQDFQRAKETFPIYEYEKEFRNLEILRLQFTRKFSLKKLESMTIDQFVIGKQRSDSFCYFIERKLDGLGRILGRPSNKFGVWYSPDKQCYSFDSRFGKNAKEAFENIKNNIIKLLEDAKNKNKQNLINNPIDSLFKGKILSTYFPNMYLNIFSSGHLDYYLRFFNLDSNALMKSDAILKREVLLEFKNNDADMRKWSINMFAVFLYRHYPKRPLSEKEVAVKSRHKEIIFPTFNDVEWVTNQIAPKQSDDTKFSARAATRNSPDYEEDAKEHKRLGDRGEYIVYCAELERIQKDLNVSEKRAEKYIDWKSRKGEDGCGYDILSVNKDLSQRYIEVKATQRSVGDTIFYYTENELRFAKQQAQNYHIYIVYDILKKKPKIWDLGNPFKEEGVLDLQPIKYIVRVKTKK